VLSDATTCLDLIIDIYIDAPFAWDGGAEEGPASVGFDGWDDLTEVAAFVPVDVLSPLRGAPLNGSAIWAASSPPPALSRESNATIVIAEAIAMGTARRRNFEKDMKAPECRKQTWFDCVRPDFRQPNKQP
jgi:hypothetical protein